MDERCSALEFRRGARPTPAAERALFELLRSRAGRARWRRQHPVGPYVVAFCCPERAVAVEIATEPRAPDARFHDEVRARFLAAHGLRLLTFTAQQVLAHPSLVAASVAVALAEPAGIAVGGRARSR